MTVQKDKSNLIINSITLAIFLIELSEYKHKLAIIKAITNIRRPSVSVEDAS